MRDDDSDTEQIDLLVRELMADRPVELTPTPAVSPLAAALPAEQRPGSRWTNVRVLMPSARTAGRRNRFALATTIARLQLRKLTRFFKTLSPVASVRMWVGLAAVYGAS